MKRSCKSLGALLILMLCLVFVPTQAAAVASGTCGDNLICPNECSEFDLSYGSITISEQNGVTEVYQNSSCYTVSDDTVTIRQSAEEAAHNIVIESGEVSLIIEDLCIVTEEGSPIEVKEDAELTLNLSGSSSLTSNSIQPAICVEDGATLIIEGDGSLTVRSIDAWDGYAGAICGPASYIDGSDYHEPAHCVIINGGTINAYGELTSAGIYAGQLTVNGGTVNAYSGPFASALIAGEFEMNGGSVNAYGGEMAGGLYGIDSITITGGSFYAEVGEYATAMDSRGSIYIQDTRLHMICEGEGGYGIRADEEVSLIHCTGLISSEYEYAVQGMTVNSDSPLLTLSRTYGSQTIYEQISYQRLPDVVYGLRDDTVVLEVITDRYDLTYHWQESSDNENWTVFAYDGGSSHTMTVDQGSIGKYFRCMLINGTGAVAYTNSTRICLCEFTSQPADRWAYPGDEVTIPVKFSPDDVDYQWQYSRDGVSWDDMPGMTDAAVEIPCAADGDGGFYRCVVTGDFGTCISDSAQLSLYTELNILENPENVAVTVGNAAKFSVVAEGEELAYQWQYRTSSSGRWTNTTYPGCKTATLTIPGTSVTAGRDGYQYRCRVVDSFGHILISDPATLTVYSTPMIDLALGDITVSEDQGILTVNQNGSCYVYDVSDDTVVIWQSVNAMVENRIVVESGSVSLIFRDLGIGHDETAPVEIKDGASLVLEPEGWNVLESTGQKPGVWVHPNARLTICGDGTLNVDAWRNGIGGEGQTGTIAIQDAVLNVKSEYGTAISGFSVTITDTSGSVKGYDHGIAADRISISDSDLEVSCTSDEAGATPYYETIADRSASGPVQIFEDGTFTVTAIADSYSGVTHQWQQYINGRWTDLAGQTRNSYNVDLTSANDGKKFRCAISSVWGNTLYTGETEMQIVSVLKQPDPVQVYPGEYAEFKVETSHPIRYQWQRSEDWCETWVDLPGETEPVLSYLADAADDQVCFQCVLTCDWGSGTTRAAYIEIKIPLVIDKHPQNQICAAGTTASFSVEATGYGLSYQWMKCTDGGDWKNISGATNATLNYRTELRDSEVQLCCAIKDGYGVVEYTDPATLRVVIPATILTQPEDVTTAVGKAAKFFVEADGTDLTYRWQYRTSPAGKWTYTQYTGYNTATLTIPASAMTTGRSGYQYRCVITDVLENTLYTDPATLTVAVPASIQTQPGDLAAVLNTDAVFSVDAAGTGLEYQWQYRTSSTGKWYNTKFAGYDTAVLTISAGSVTVGRDGYQYRCKITDVLGNTLYTDPATLTVLVPAAIQVQPEDVTTAVGKAVSFTVEADGTDLTYRWQYRTSSTGKWASTKFTGYNTATLTIPAGSVTESRNGYQYRCVIIDALENTLYTDAATLTVAVPASIRTQSGDMVVEMGKAVSFTVEARGTGLKYQWQFRTSSTGKWANSSAAGSKTDTVSTTATNARNGYEYRCRVTDVLGNVVYSDAAVLTVATPASIVGQPRSITAAEGKTVSFSVDAEGTGLTYRWQFRTSSTGKWANSSAAGSKTNTVSTSAINARNGYQYRCEVTDVLGNVVYSDAATLSVTIPASIQAQPEDLAAVLNTDADFTVSAKGTGLKYQWQYRTSSTGKWYSTKFTGYNTATLTIPAGSVTAGRDGYQYRCKITDALENTLYTDPATLSVIIPASIQTQPKDVKVNSGTAAKFTVKVTGADVTYQWQYRTSSTGKWYNTSFTGNKTATLTIPAISVTTGRDGYQYRCKVTASGKTMYSDPATITVKKFAINAQPQDVTVFRGSTVKFTVKATGVNVTYQWQYRTSGMGKWYNTSFTGNKTATLTIPAASVTSGRDGYQYRCAVTSNGKTIYTSAAELQVW